MFYNGGARRRRRWAVDFDLINRAACRDLKELVQKWLPGGSFRHHEYVALNPRRADREPGSFKINVTSGRWADFATDDRGGDPISLYAFLHGLSQFEAAQELADQLGLRA